MIFERSISSSSTKYRFPAAEVVRRKARVSDEAKPQRGCSLGFESRRNFQRTGPLSHLDVPDA